MSYEAFEPCVVTGIEGDGMVCYHHLLTRKSHPEFSEERWNMIPVSLMVHNDFHNHGTPFMAKKYQRVKKWLLDHDWFFCDVTEKWRHGES